MKKYTEFDKRGINKKWTIVRIEPTTSWRMARESEANIQFIFLGSGCEKFLLVRIFIGSFPYK